METLVFCPHEHCRQKTSASTSSIRTPLWCAAPSHKGCRVPPEMWYLPKQHLSISNIYWPPLPVVPFSLRQCTRVPAKISAPTISSKSILVSVLRKCRHNMSTKFQVPHLFSTITLVFWTYPLVFDFKLWLRTAQLLSREVLAASLPILTLLRRGSTT